MFETVCGAVVKITLRCNFLLEVLHHESELLIELFLHGWVSDLGRNKVRNKLGQLLGVLFLQAGSLFQNLGQHYLTHHFALHTLRSYVVEHGRVLKRLGTLGKSLLNECGQKVSHTLSLSLSYIFVESLGNTKEGSEVWSAFYEKIRVFHEDV